MEDVLHRYSFICQSCTLVTKHLNLQDVLLILIICFLNIPFAQKQLRMFSSRLVHFSTTTETTKCLWFLQLFYSFSGLEAPGFLTTILFFPPVDSSSVAVTSCESFWGRITLQEAAAGEYSRPSPETRASLHTCCCFYCSSYANENQNRWTELMLM